MDIIKRKKNRGSRPQEEILLGIDYGDAHIGLAFGRANLATPLSVIPAKNLETAMDEIGRIVFENKINKILLGLPLSAQDKETEQSARVRKFSKLLKTRLKKPVTFVNEYNTTREAVKGAIDAGNSKKRRSSVDHISAALIVKRYYEEMDTSFESQTMH